MLITIIILAVLLLINLVATGMLVVRYGNQSADFTQLRKDFAIVEGLLTPFLQWIDQVNKQRETMERMAKEKADALINQKKE